eukprot:366485-Chlamydomonas_euryale.AAC.17
MGKAGKVRGDPKRAWQPLPSTSQARQQRPVCASPSLPAAVSGRGRRVCSASSRNISSARAARPLGPARVSTAGRCSSLVWRSPCARPRPAGAAAAAVGPARRSCCAALCRMHLPTSAPRVGVPGPGEMTMASTWPSSSIARTSRRPTASLVTTTGSAARARRHGAAATRACMRWQSERQGEHRCRLAAAAFGHRGSCAVAAAATHPH